MLKNIYKLILTALLFNLFLVPSKVSATFDEVEIKAHAIVCEKEEYLPDWALGTGPDISENTAQEFVNNSNGKCVLESGWSFQWGYNDKEDKDGVDKLIGTLIGPANGVPSVCDFQCGPNTKSGSEYEDWKEFNSPTGSNGEAARVGIGDLNGAPGIWVRVNLKSGYVPYSYPPFASMSNRYSAEMLCHDDGNNYDNYDQVWDPEFNNTYYCVVLTVREGQVTPPSNPGGNPSEDDDEDEDENEDDEDEEDEEKDEDEGEVLGASTTSGNLPKTGAQDAWMYLSIFLLVASILLIISHKYSENTDKNK